MADWWYDSNTNAPKILRDLSQIITNISNLNSAIGSLSLADAIQYITDKKLSGDPIGQLILKYVENYDGTVESEDNEIKQYLIGSVNRAGGGRSGGGGAGNEWGEYVEDGGPVSIFGNAQETEDVLPYLTLMTKAGAIANALEIGVLGYVPLPTVFSALLPYLGYKANQEFFDVSWKFDDFVSQFLHFTFEDNGFLVPAIIDTLGQVFVFKSLFDKLKEYANNWGIEIIENPTIANLDDYFPAAVSNAAFWYYHSYPVFRFTRTTGFKKIVYYNTSSTAGAIIAVSDEPFTLTTISGEGSNREQAWSNFINNPRTTTASTSSYTFNNKTVYYYSNLNASNSSYIDFLEGVANEERVPSIGTKDRLIAWCIMYDDSLSPHLPHGIERKPEPFVPEEWPYPPFVLENEVTMDLSELVPINIPESSPWLTSEDDPDTPSTNEALEPYLWPQVPQEAFPYYDPNENPDLAYDPEEATAPYPDPNNNTYIIPIILPDLIPEVDDILPDVDVPVPSSSGLSPENNIPDVLLWPTIVPPYDSGGVSGMIHVYNPTASEFINFGKWLWVTYADATIDKIWNNPFDGIIGCHEIYAPVPIDVQKEEIRSGFLVSDTSAYTVPTRYIEVNCGSVIVPEYWNNYLDYAPYTKAFIYLPFIGIVELEADDIIGHAVQVKYGVDMYTGACVAKIMVAKNDYRNCLYQFSGNCAVDVPLSGGSQASIKGSMIAAAAFGLNGIAQGIISGGGIASGVASAISNVVTHAVSQKSSVQHSGTFGAAFGAMSTKKPYLIIKRPIQKVVPNYNQDYGYPAHKMVTLGNCKGYVRVREINVISPTANNDEKARIEALLKDGVYITQ